eukprot:GHVU01130962.1.p2 GENE.GHVU01130962.1~~GHVU01130962.1.p2  ORF type:complete len:154 (-),score=13.66 GHVU01130962.1:854-1315(-)
MSAGIYVVCPSVCLSVCLCVSVRAMQSYVVSTDFADLPGGRRATGICACCCCCCCCGAPAPPGGCLRSPALISSRDKGGGAFDEAASTPSRIDRLLENACRGHPSPLPAHSVLHYDDGPKIVVSPPHTCGGYVCTHARTHAHGGGDVLREECA